MSAPALSFELDRDDWWATTLRGDPANLDVYDPGQRQRVPPGGAWAMIVRRLPPLGGGVDRHLRVGRLFFLEHLSEADDAGFLPDGRYKVMCRSPWGDVHLYPYEYSVFEPAAVVDLWTAGEVVFHPLRIDGARLSEISFYARSRGIGLADAAVVALGALTGPIGWFEPRPDLAEPCEEMERSVHRPWPVRCAAPYITPVPASVRRKGLAPPTDHFVEICE